ncbi:MAG: polyphosphate kinase 1 [Treponema sp.]|nr:polyphosphate kinase 1 [Treponema sp.]
MKEITPLFFNRELSWIEFNARVLHEAFRKDLPLIERLRFIAIVSSNFDEFFQVRVAAIKRLYRVAPHHKDSSGLTPEELLKQISIRCHQIIKLQHSCLSNDVLPELAKKGLEYVPPVSYTEQQKSFLEKLFKKDILPVLTSIRTDTIFPNTENMRLYAAFLLENIPGIHYNTRVFDAPLDSQILGLVPIPSNIQRVIWLPSASNTKAFTVLDDLIMTFGTQMFPGYSTKETLIFKVARDADFSVNEEGDNLTKEMQEVLVKRRSSFAVRLLCNAASPVITKILIEKLQLTNDDVYEFPGLIDPSTLLNGIENTKEAEPLTYPNWSNYNPISLPDDKPYWDTLRQHDVLLHVPYESYEPVIKFLNDAANDDNVLAIKMTLYRTGSHSPVVKALEKAAKKGKQVTVFVELKARFDEGRNISWAEELERAGAIVIYGIVGLKVHAKMLLIIRRESDGLRRYVHLSTGNYNPKTAKTYSDISIFTSNSEIATDTTLFFNAISGYSQFLTLKHLYMAPINLKGKILSMIDREIHCSTPDQPGLIIAKMNSLGHEGVIKALYAASQAGVQVLLNVRGICMLVPGVKGMSENIKVVSIVDRYLEHSRIFYFKNGGAEELYLSSADWMPRNLERRVEMMFPVADKNLFKVVKDTLDIYFKDNSHSYLLQSDGTWKASKPDKKESIERAQEVLHKKYKKQADLYEKQPKTEFIVRRK